MTSRTMRAALAALLLSGMTGVFAQQIATGGEDEGRSPESTPALERKAVDARQQENWTDLYSYSLELHQRRPFVPGYMLELIRASAAMGERQQAYQYMLKLQQSGLSYDMNEIPQTAPMRDAEAYQHINNLMLEAAKPLGTGHEFQSVPMPPTDVGDLAWDGSRQTLLLGTRREGKVLAVAENGTIEELLAANQGNGPWSIGGLAVDVARNTLWIASSTSSDFAGHSPAEARRAALFRFDLATLELLERFDVQTDRLPHELGSIALTAAGDVYVIDRAVPLIFRKSSDSNRLEHFAAMPKLVSLTDIAVTEDNSRLFVADAVMGVLLIDPAAGTAAPLQGPENLNLFGITGIEYANGEIVITQGGISPERVMRLKLDSAGAAVESVVPMAVALEGFDRPGTGALKSDNLYFVANHHAAKATETTRLMIAPLDSGEEIKSPDMRLFEQMLRERLQEDGQPDSGPQ